MKLFDKMKDLVLGSDEYDDFEDVEQGDEYEDAPVKSSSSSYEPFEKFEPMESFEAKKSEKNKVVDFSSAATSAPTYQRSTSSSSSNSASRPHVVVAKLEKFEDVGEVAKSINEKRMVIINLENADNATTQRIIDFIYGVTIANNSELKRVAFRTYIIKPAGYDYTGGDGFDSNNMDGIVFGAK